MAAAPIFSSDEASADELRHYSSYIPLSYAGVRDVIPVIMPSPAPHADASSATVAAPVEPAVPEPAVSVKPTSRAAKEAAPSRGSGRRSSRKGKEPAPRARAPSADDVSIVKMVMREGWSDTTPAEGCPTTVHYIGRTCDGAVFATTLDMYGGKCIGGTDKPAVLSLLRVWDDSRGAFERDNPSAYVPEGLHVAVSSMLRGEVSRFWLPPVLAYGGHGDGRIVPAHATVVFDVLLVTWSDALPPLLPRDSVERVEEERRREEREQLLASERPSLLCRITEANKLKEVGNAALKRGEHAASKRAYDIGFVNLYIGKDEWDVMADTEPIPAALLHGSSEPLSRGERQRLLEHMIASAKLPLCLNRSLVCLKMGALEDALWDANQALALIPSAHPPFHRADTAAPSHEFEVDYDMFHAKALYRRAAVRAAQLDVDFAKEDARPRQFWDPDRAADNLTAAKADVKHAVDILRASGHPVDAGMAALVRSLAERGKRLRELTETAAKERRDKLSGFFQRDADARVRAASSDADAGATQAAGGAASATGDGPVDPAAAAPSKNATAVHSAVDPEEEMDLPPLV